MKKRMITALIGFCSILPMMSQDFKAGVTAGVNVNAPSDLNSKIGFNVGVTGELGLPVLSKGWYANAAILLSAQGWKSITPFESNGIKEQELTASPYYLNVPLHVGCRFPLCKQFAVFVNVGRISA